MVWQSYADRRPSAGQLCAVAVVTAAGCVPAAARLDWELLLPVAESSRRRWFTHRCCPARAHPVAAVNLPSSPPPPPPLSPSSQSLFPRAATTALLAAVWLVVGIRLTGLAGLGVRDRGGLTQRQTSARRSSTEHSTAQCPHASHPPHASVPLRRTRYAALPLRPGQRAVPCPSRKRFRRFFC